MTEVIGDVFNSFIKESEESVELGKSYQDKLINVFCEDRTGFSEAIIDVLDSSYFDGYQKTLINYCINYYNERGTIMRFTTLRDRINFREKGIIKEQLISLVNNIESLNVEDSKEVQDSSRTFFKKRAMREVILKAALKWKKNDLDGIVKDFEEALKAGEPKDTGHDYIKDVHKRLSKDFRMPITIMKGLDEIIGGGVSPGELLVVVSPPGGGKSMTLVKFASTALLDGKKVVYYTLELSEESVGQRFDACINEIALSSVWDYPEYISDKLEEISNNGGGLKIKEFLEGGVTVNTIKAHLKTLELEGFVPDMILVDYLGLMKPLGSYSEKRHGLTDISEGLRAIANNFKVPVLSAHQANRSAIQEDKINTSHIGESLGIMATVDIGIGIGRSDELKEDNQAMLGIMKNRNGRDGTYILMNFDTRKVFLEFIDQAEETVSAVSVGEPSLESIASEIVESFGV